MRLPDPTQGTLVGQVLGLCVTFTALLVVFHMRQRGASFEMILDDPGLLFRGMLDQTP